MWAPGSSTWAARRPSVAPLSGPGSWRAGIIQEPQYAWDYASVRLAEKALVYAEFNTHPREGVVGVEDFGSGSYPAAEPQGYFRRWRYTAGGQIERF